MNSDLVRRVLMIGVVAGTGYAMSRQCRKPSGGLGRRLARGMNVGHRALTDWGLQRVTLAPRGRVLDVGCGGGQTIHTLATATQGRIDGIDYSDASVAVARRTNAGLIAEGRVHIQQGSVSRLPFEDATFDLVTACETHYYWPDLTADLREIRRVLRPGGRVLLVAEAYRGRRMDWLYRPAMVWLLRATYLTLDEHRAVLAEAGFANIVVEADTAHGWMRAEGVNPELPAPPRPALKKAH